MTKRHWPFMLAVALQAAILAAVPARHMNARLTGRTIFLKTAPVDPYDIMSGYHVVLGYVISRPSDLPGSPAVGLGETIYVALNEGDDGLWHAAQAYKEYPREAPAGEVVIKGVMGRWTIDYGIENYYVPEGKGKEIEDALRLNRDNVRVEVRVDGRGNAALVRLHAGDKTYDY